MFKNRLSKQQSLTTADNSAVYMFFSKGGVCMEASHTPPDNPNIILDKFGGYRIVDLQREIDSKLMITSSSQFLVLNLKCKESGINFETLCIVQRCKTDRHGSEITQLHWGFVNLAEYTFPEMPVRSYTMVIHGADILECVGQFVTLEEAAECFNSYKNRPAASLTLRG